MSEYRLGLYEKALPSGLPLEELLHCAKRAGFDFLELSIDESDARLKRLELSAKERNAWIDAMRETGLPIRTMCLSGHRKYPLGSRDPATRARGMEIFRQAVDLADDLGIRLIQLAGYDVYYETGGADTEAVFFENLRACVRYAAQRGVILGFETMETPFMDTVGKAMRYVERVGSPYLGVYPDLGNLTNAAAVYGGDVLSDLKNGAGHLFAMHLKETEPGKYRDMRFGTGHVAFDQGIRAALELGTRMFVTECWDDGRRDYEEAVREVVRFIRPLFDAALATA